MNDGTDSPKGSDPDRSTTDTVSQGPIRTEGGKSPFEAIFDREEAVSKHGARRVQEKQR